MAEDPRYELRDSEGTLLGALYATSDGAIAIEHAASGDEAVVDGDGITAPAITTDDAQVTHADIATVEDSVQVDLPAPQSGDSDLILYVGGTWVGTDDPEVEYPGIVEDGHRWYNPVDE